MGRQQDEEMLLFPSSFSFLPADSFADAATDTSGSVGSCGGEPKKARRQRRRKPKPALADGDAAAVDDQAKKRRLSDDQARYLELRFREERKLETPRKVQLAAELGLDAKQVAVWFQNRRARHKSKLMEEEFAKLRDAHDRVVLHNCHLETELLKLKDRLAEAEEEKSKLIIASSAAAMTGNGAGSSSPSSSSFSTVTCNNPGAAAPLLGQFAGGVEEEAADLSYMSDYAYNNYMMDFAATAGYFGGVVYDHPFN